MEIEKVSLKSDKPLKNSRRSAFIFTFAGLMFVTVALAAGTFSARQFYLNNYGPVAPEANTLSGTSWAINKVDPNPDGKGFDLTVESAIGNLRRYPGVRSYGLSNNGRILALSSETGFRLVDLSADDGREIALPFGYSGDIGEAITWSFDDEELALILLKEGETQPSLVIMSADGAIIEEIQTDFTSYSNQGFTAYYPAKFSPRGKLLLTRTYMVDGTTPDLAPAYLQVYNLDGGLRKEFFVRDVVPKANQITYFWDATGMSILYSVDPAGTELDFSKLFRFTEEYIGFS